MVEFAANVNFSALRNLASNELFFTTGIFVIVHKLNRRIFKMHKLYDFIEARERLTTVVVKTKLMHSPVFSEESGNEIYL